MDGIAIEDSDLDFGPVHGRMQWYVDQGMLPSVATAVLHEGRLVDCQTFGAMDLETQRPLLPDAIYRIFSNTKKITSVAAMMLYERGCFQLDDALADYLPAFSEVQVLKPDAQSERDLEPARSPMTVRQVMSHSAGLSYGFVEPHSLIDRLYGEAGITSLITVYDRDLEGLCEMVARQPLAYQPGSDWRYSVSADVLARLIELWSGQRFGDFLREHIFAPLGMIDSGFHVPEDKLDRLVTMYAPTPKGMVSQDAPPASAWAAPRALQSGGAGLVSTMADYLRFVQMLAGGGELDGTRILQPQTLALMLDNQLEPDIQVRFPFWEMPDTVFGLGFALKRSPAEGEPDTAIDEYHWGGMAGTHSFIAPRAKLAGLCFTQVMPFFWHPFSHDFKRAAYKAVS
ncbi:MAG: serine hydrolase [Myxococcales bacterium]|nr:serine hydrolase [Myxococcales bacterium]